MSYSALRIDFSWYHLKPGALTLPVTAITQFCLRVDQTRPLDPDCYSPVTNSSMNLKIR